MSKYMDDKKMHKILELGRQITVVCGMHNKSAAYKCSDKWLYVDCKRCLAKKNSPQRTATGEK